MKNLFFLSSILVGFISLSVVPVYSQNFWEETNGPEGGLVQCIAVGKDNTIYAGFDAGQFGPDHLGRGLYKSIDSGVSWQVININSNKDVQSITIDTSGTIFLWVLGAGVLRSTDEGNSWVLSSPGLLSDGVISSFKNNYLVVGEQDGLYFSTDNGDSWIHNSLEGSVHYIFVDDYDNVFVAIDDGYLYKSTDYGISWSAANLGLTGSVKAITQTNDSTLYAGTYSGVFTSSDFGGNWIYLDNSPQNITSLLAGRYNEIYAGTTKEGIFISKDRGISWQQKNNGLKYYYVTDIVNLSTDQIIIGTYGVGLFTSNNDGRYWYSINSGIKSVHITSFLKFKNYLFAGSEQGVLFKTSDRGDTWEQIDSIYTKRQIYSFTKTSKHSLFFSSWDGIFKSEDKGNTWSKVSNLFSLSFTTYLDTLLNIEYIFTATGSGSIHRSTDDGNNWSLVNSGLGNRVVTDLKSNSSGIVFASNNDAIYRSTDYGVNWEIIYEAPMLVYKIYLAVSPNDYLYAGFDWGKVFLSTDNGNTWIDRGQDLPVNRINSVTTDSLNRVYVGNWWGQIYQSVDYGEHWIDIKSGTIGGPILNLFSDNSGNIFAGPYGGSVYRGINSIFVPPQVIMYSPLSGSENQPLNTELNWYSSPSADNYRIEVSLSNNFDSAAVVFEINASDTAATTTTLSENTTYYWRVSASNQFGQSIWSTPWTFTTLLTTQVEDTLSMYFSYELSQNYPNPFNPTTTIKYQIQETGRVLLYVYDVLGNEVATLVNEEKSPGTYEVTFDAAGLPSGVYFYQLRAGNFIETKKMLLIK